MEYSEADSSQQIFQLNKLQEAAKDITEKKSEIAQIEEAIAKTYNDQSEVTRKENNILYESQSDQETSLTRLEQSLKRLKIAIENWRRDYLLLATEDGTITFFGKRSASNVYQQNQEILYIIPPQNGDAYIGNLRVPLDQSGRIEEGQSVYLKFDEFPFKKFGYIEGKVKRKVNF